MEVKALQQFAGIVKLIACRFTRDSCTVTAVFWVCNNKARFEKIVCRLEEKGVR